MIYVFAIGVGLLALALPVPGDVPLLARASIRRRLWQTGAALIALAVIAGEYNAAALVALIVMVVLFVTAIGLLFWLEDGRFTADRMRASLGWYFVNAGPAGAPMGGHRLLALVTVLLLAVLLVVRPVVREILGLNQVEVTTSHAGLSPGSTA
ncbi:hypothetical protein [Actibacterium sp. 188UL27-1]|uniref:hypothetical protein n=1 Tax=Actibacterium sp. 188UL27-1 TaxID=2786961 RepID=UPI0019571D3D|nr:hypothetical protein [Actibacterium sp. 188UL27-1]MBM7070103.1 hypothetical protein [Actibacterium sp. 188UL27-1]